MDRIMKQDGNMATILVIFILGTVLFFYLTQTLTPLLVQKRQLSHESVKTNLEMAMGNLRATLNNNEAFKAIVNHADNTAMRCLSNATCTYDMPFQDLFVFSLDGVPLAKGDLHGFNTKGQPCSALQDACVFITSIKWKPQCPADGSVCVNPSIEIMGSVGFKNSLYEFPLNFSRYRFSLRKENVGMLIN